MGSLSATSGSLTPRAPFDFQKGLDFLAAFDPMQGEQVIGEGELCKALAEGGRTVVYSVRGAGSVKRPTVDYTLWSEGRLTQKQKQAVLDRIDLFLGLSEDLRPFYDRAAKDPAFQPIVERLHGMHHVKLPSPFEAACWAVLAARAPMPVARKMKRAIVERWGSSLEVSGVTYSAFPEQPSLGGASEADLAETIGNRRRAAYLHEVIRAFSDVDESWLRTAPYDEADAWLKEIRGIGPWSAAFVLLRAVGRADNMPVNLGPIISGIETVYGKRVEPRQIEARYGDQVGLWGVYLRFGTLTARSGGGSRRAPRRR